MHINPLKELIYQRRQNISQFAKDVGESRQTIDNRLRSKFVFSFFVEYLKKLEYDNFKWEGGYIEINKK